MVEHGGPAQLPIEVQVGQLFVVGLAPGGRFLEAMQEHFQNHYGGVFLNRNNIRSIDQTRRLNHRFRRHTRDIPPMFVSIDEEGGMVTNTGHITTPAPSAQALGMIDDEAVTEDVYFGLGEKLRALGFNTVFAPVLDVNVEKSNPVIGTRSFGEAPELVGRHGRAAIAGLNAADIVFAGKHFPGHGATETDSHHTLPRVKADRETIDDRELEPFREAFAVDRPPSMVMSAHVAFPGLDKSGVPATLSPIVLRDILRREMRYQGALITDAMEMEGISGPGPERAAVGALQAGVDLLLYPLDPKMAGVAYKAVLKAVQSGKISEERIAWSVDRVFQIRQIFRGQRWFTDAEADEVLNVAHEAAFFQGALDALQVEGNAGVLGQIPATPGPKLLVMPKALDPHRSLPLGVLTEQLQPAGFSLMEVEPDPTGEEISRAEGRAAEASVVVVGTASRGPMTEARQRLVAALTRRDVIKVGVALLDPADTEQMMTANCRIRTFGFGPAQLWALSQKLLG